ncbi:hypothetical protein F5B20DRAFT_593678 [Whalleya microplaca]|nr:hypothetical protein F5B20DRAFT_593678 [Whalleya microplaca]
MALSTFTCFPQMPLELRRMVWECYKLPRHQMLHVISQNPGDNGSWQLVTLGVKEHFINPEDLPTIRSLLRVNMEASEAVLDRRTVFPFDPHHGDMAACYGMLSPDGVVQRIEMRCAFVNFDQDLFYMTCDDPCANMPLWKSQSFVDGVRSIGFNIRAIFLPGAPINALKNLYSLYLIIPRADLRKELNRRFEMTPEFRTKMLAKTSDPTTFGFSPPVDDLTQYQGNMIEHGNGGQICQFTEDLIKQSIEGVRNLAVSLVSICLETPEDAHPITQCDKCWTLCDTQMVIDHLGYWDFAFQGYNKLSNPYLQYQAPAP